MLGRPGHSLIFEGFPEVQEVSRNHPGVRGFILAEYGHMAIHGDPTHEQNDECSAFPA